jgi:hypothetical protein
MSAARDALKAASLWGTFGRGHDAMGNEDGRLDPGGNGQGRGVRAVGALPAHDRAAVDRGRRVVGVALESGGQAEDRLKAQLVGLAQERARGRERGDHRRGRRTEALAMRDRVDGADLEAGAFRSEQAERLAERADEQVRLVRGDATGALALHLDHDVGPRQEAHLDGVNDTERHAERIEPRAEVARARGDNDADAVRDDVHGRRPIASRPALTTNPRSRQTRAHDKPAFTTNPARRRRRRCPRG